MIRFFDQVYQLVSLVPPGKVVSYGQVAALLGVSHAARTVGWALHGLPEDSPVPWQRVINYRGRITNTSSADIGALQQALLEAEGIRFGPDGRVDMEVYRWEGPTFAQLDAILRAND
jgi:methylated-DNA-protein-cysteine methyltransferase related protein